MLILIWRYKRTILNNRSKIGEAFSIVGIVVTIIYLICIVSFLSMTYSHYELINHPCQNLERSENEIKYYNYSDYVPTFEDNKEDFCIENPDYRVYTVPVIEYIVVFLFAGVLSIFMLLLIYSWFNDYRRIKFLIEGSLYDFDAQEINVEVKKRNEDENSHEKRINERISKKQNTNLNNKYLYKIYSQQENGIRYDIYGRPIFKINKPNVDTNNINNANTNRFNKRKNILNNRISIYKARNSVQFKNPSELGFSSSERKIQFSRNQNNNNITKTKTTTKENLI
jgi:hypothetical protein